MLRDIVDLALVDTIVAPKMTLIRRQRSTRGDIGSTDPIIRWINRALPVTATVFRPGERKVEASSPTRREVSCTLEHFFSTRWSSPVSLGPNNAASWLFVCQWQLLYVLVVKRSGQVEVVDIIKCRWIWQLFRSPRSASREGILSATRELWLKREKISAARFFSSPTPRYPPSGHVVISHPGSCHVVECSPVLVAARVLEDFARQFVRSKSESRPFLRPAVLDAPRHNVVVAYWPDL
jgi:hypothetical protein